MNEEHIEGVVYKRNTRKRYYDKSRSFIRRTRQTVVKGLKKVSTALGVDPDRSYKNIKQEQDRDDDADQFAPMIPDESSHMHDYSNSNAEKLNAINEMDEMNNAGADNEKDLFFVERNEQWSEFLKASFDGQEEKVQMLLEKGDSIIDEQDNIGLSALMIASSCGHTEVMQSLLNKGAQIDLIDNSGWSALMIASWKGHIEVVKLLLEKGAQVNMRENDGWSALMIASHTEVVKLLLEKGAQVNMRNNDGWSALMIASQNGHTEVVELLLEKGAEVDMQENDEWSALMMASQNGHTEVVKLLLEKGAKVNMRDNTGLSSLYIASHNGHTEVVELLLEKGAQVNTRNNNGWSALMKASHNGHTEMVKLLLEKGAKVDMGNNNGFSALMKASQNGHTEVVKLLLEKGVQVDMQENNGWSALMIASHNGHTEVVELLLEKGAQVDMGNNNGSSALHAASQNGHIEVVKLLLEKGAQVNMQDNTRLSSLYLASQNGHTEVVKLLLENGAQVNVGVSALAAAVEGRHSEPARLLLQYGAHIECNSEGTPLLELATNYDIIKVDQRDNRGKTALMYASSNGRPDTVSLLLEKGAQIDMQDNNGWFSLMYAAQAGDLEICSLLVAYGANVHLTNYEGDTIFDVCSHEVLTFSLQNLLKTLLDEENSDIKIDSNYPGIYFFQVPINEHITSTETSIHRLENVGISIFIPENSLSIEEEFLDLSVHPCFSGPFELPDGYKSASPTYLITHSRRVIFLKDVTVKIHHYACLKREEDCEDMVFLSASSTPVYGESGPPVYVFRRIQGAKGIFKPGDQVGEISLRHFCLLKIGKRKREEDEKEEVDDSESSPKLSKGDETYYSARLYRDLNPSHAHEASAVFCMCLYHPMYIQHCDRRIMEGHTSMLGKWEGRSEIIAQMVSEEVVISATGTNEWSVRFDKKPTKIRKRDIHLPEVLKIRVSDLLDYPPKFIAHIKAVISTASNPPELQVSGLDIGEFSFELPTPTPKSPSQSMDDQSGTSPSVSEAKNEFAKANPTAVPSSTIDDTTLGTNDLGDVFDAVETLSASWEVLATKLRIQQHTVEAILKNYQGNVHVCLIKMLEQWLKLNYDYQKYGRPSWRIIAKSVQRMDPGLFEEIARDHPTAQGHMTS